VVARNVMNIYTMENERSVQQRRKLNS